MSLAMPASCCSMPALAVVVVAVGILFLRLFGGLERFVETPGGARWDWCAPWLPACWSPAWSSVEPGVFGTGQAVTNRLLSGDVSEVWWVLILLALAKVAGHRSHSFVGGVGWGFHALVVHRRGGGDRFRPAR